MLPYLRWVPLALGCLLAVASFARAEVRDDTGLFSQDAERQADRIIKEIKDRYKKDMVVETFKSIPADRMAEYTKAADEREARARFFNAWAFGFRPTSTPECGSEPKSSRNAPTWCRPCFTSL